MEQGYQRDDYHGHDGYDDHQQNGYEGYYDNQYDSHHDDRSHYSQIRPSSRHYYQNNYDEGVSQSQYDQFADHGSDYNAPAYHDSHDHYGRPQSVPEDGLVVPVLPRVLRQVSPDSFVPSDSRAGLSTRVAGLRKGHTHNGLMSSTEGLDDSSSGDIFENEGPRHTSNSSPTGRGLRGRNPPTSRGRVVPRNFKSNSARSFASVSSGDYGHDDGSDDAFENEGESVYSGRSGSQGWGSRDRPIPVSNGYTPTKYPPVSAASPSSVGSRGHAAMSDSYEDDLEGYSVRSGGTHNSSRYYPDDTATRTPGADMPTGSHRGAPALPGSHVSSDSSSYGLKSARPAWQDQVMDGSAVSQGSLPGASYSADNSPYARKAGWAGRQGTSTRGRYLDDESHTSVPGAASELGGSGRYHGKEYMDRSRRSLMRDESIASIPGAVYESGGSRRDLKGSRMAPMSPVRGQDSLRLLDENIQHSIKRQEFPTNRNDNFNQIRPGAMPESGPSRRFKNLDTSSDTVDGQRSRYETGASMRSVADDRYTAKIRSQEERMKESLRTVDGLTKPAQGFISARMAASPTDRNGNSRPGIFRGDSQSTPQDAALRAKLNSHFGEEPKVEEKEGDFSHVTMLQPRRYSFSSTQCEPVLERSRATSSVSRATSSVSRATSSVSRAASSVQEDASIEMHQDEPEGGSVSRATVPRELTVENDVQQAIPSSKRKEGPSLWFLAKCGLFIFVCFVAASIGIYLGLVVFAGDTTTGAEDGKGDYGVGFEEGLPATTLAILAENDPGAPQYMAMQWLQKDELFRSYPVWRKRQRFALCTIYFALYYNDEVVNEPWFRPNVDECEWQWNPDEPVVCDNGRYSQLSLRLDRQQTVDVSDLFDVADGNTTSSSAAETLLQSLVMPLEVGMLHLDHFKLSHIPENSELAYLLRPEMLASEDLIKLEISRSPKLGGTIPTEIGLLSNLKYLYFDDTGLMGTIPTEIGQLTKLKEVNIVNCNGLTGSIPSEVGSMKEAELFWVFFNKNVTGSIPTEIGLMTNMIFVTLKSNKLKGILPSELGLLTAMGEFKCGNNDLSGTIPSEIGSWSTLRVLDISDNARLRGTIPVQICNLRSDQVESSMDCERVACCDHWLDD